MLEIREIELPGIGRKYALLTEDGARLTVILHNSGHREIYLFDKGADFPTSAVRLDDRDGRGLGAILAGAYYQPVGEADLATVLGQMAIDWHEVGPAMAGRTIGALEIRSKTGASVIAVLRKEGALPNPGPGTTLRQGDTLVLIGTREQIEAFRRRFAS
ncbi:MAG: cation:proton antiporter regulatory subunit [Gemmatimonadota bacterium]